MAEKTKTLKFLLFLLKIVGLDPTYQSIFTRILQLITFLSTLYIMITNVLEIALNYDGIKTISRIDFFPVLYMGFVKLICLIINNKKLLNILNYLNNLWPTIDTFETYQDIKQYHKKVNIVVIGFASSSVLVSIILIATPFITKKNSLIFPGYMFCDLDITPCFETQFVVHAFYMYFQVCPVVIPFDCIFLMLVTYGYCAIEIVNRTLRKVSELNEKEENKKLVEKKVVEIVDQHNHILDFIKLLNDYYSGLLLIQFWSTLLSLISYLYLTTYEGFPPTMEAFSRNVPMILVLAFQLLMYCFGGTILMEKTLTIADEAFQINWAIRTQPQLRKYLSMIIQRSNRMERITIGKMGLLNLVAYVSLLRQSMSMYTLLLNLESPDKKIPF